MSSDASSARRLISSHRVAYVVGACVLSLLVGVSCAMEKPPVELRLDSPPTPESIPLSEEERETLRKHPVTSELVRAWMNREFHVTYEGQTMIVPTERAYACVQKGLVVSVGLFSPKLTAADLHQQMTTAFRLWRASPAEVQRFEEWWGGNRERILDMNVGEGTRVITLSVGPSFNAEKPHIFICTPFWGFPRDRAGERQ